MGHRRQRGPWKRQSAGDPGSSRGGRQGGMARSLMGGPQERGQRAIWAAKVGLRQRSVQLGAAAETSAARLVGKGIRGDVCVNGPTKNQTRREVVRDSSELRSEKSGQGSGARAWTCGGGWIAWLRGRRRGSFGEQSKVEEQGGRTARRGWWGSRIR